MWTHLSETVCRQQDNMNYPYELSNNKKCPYDILNNLKYPYSAIISLADFVRYC